VVVMVRGIEKEAASSRRRGRPRRVAGWTTGSGGDLGSSLSMLEVCFKFKVRSSKLDNVSNDNKMGQR
jgi:hypothetical protein